MDLPSKCLKPNFLAIGWFLRSEIFRQNWNSKNISSKKYFYNFTTLIMFQPTLNCAKIPFLSNYSFCLSIKPSNFQFFTFS